jgi:hypothetical protein
VDFFYPLCDDAELMGEIAFSNVVSFPFIVSNFPIFGLIEISAD